MKILTAAISLLIIGGSMANAAEQTPEEAALGSLDTFINAWNTGKNEELRKVLNYPFLTLFGPGNLHVAEKPAQFTTNFERMREQNHWTHSTFEDSKVHAIAEDQAHIETTYSRFNAEGERYQTGQVFYIVTKQDGHWAIQFRSPLPSDEIDAEAEAAARAVIDEFFTAWNGANNAAMLKTMNLPHAFIVRNGRAAVAKTPERIATDFEAMRKREDWHHSKYKDLKIIHASPDKVLAQLTFTRHHEDDAIYATVPVLWIITKQNDHWGIQLRALLGAI